MQHKECEVCESVLESELLPANGHDYGSFTISKDATCQEEGSRYHTCSVCKVQEIQTIAIEPDAHNFSTTWTTDGEEHWYVCTNTGCQAKSCVGEHRFGEWQETLAPTCVAQGSHYKQCTVCPYSKTETIPVNVNAHNYNKGFCSRCNDKAEIVTESYTQNGKIIYFGEYPQSLKASNVAITTSTDARGYYLGSDGAYYARVAATPYQDGYTFSTGQSVTDGAVYYFKVEPIRWRILSEKNGVALIMCDSIIANKVYDSDSNNYANSTIRAWLNEQFYNTAFSTLQKALIIQTTVDNSVKSTGHIALEHYTCENTNDNIFLLSVAEATSLSHGFEVGYNSYDNERSLKASDYARATGTAISTDNQNYGNGYWFSRSPSYSFGSGTTGQTFWCICTFRFKGDLSKNHASEFTFVGIVPALQIRLS